MALMHTESKETRAVSGSRLQRAIVLALLRDDHEQRWSSAELATEMDAGAPVLAQALRALSEEGVLVISGEAAWASSAARRLDELGLISV
jgi:hypothetical protein